MLKDSSVEHLHVTPVTVLQVFFFDFATKQEPAKICAYFGVQNLVRPNQLRFSLKFFFRSVSMEIKLLSALQLL